MRKNYRVIEIIDDKNILVNFGSDQGAAEGDCLKIVVEGDPVIDPETNKSLGTFDAIKATFEIFTAYPQFSRCCRIQRRQRSILDNPLNYTSSSIQSFNIDKEDATHRTLPQVGPVKVGDIVNLC